MDLECQPVAGTGYSRAVKESGLSMAEINSLLSIRFLSQSSY
jgi:hypothetical protein